jgi:hypothetical protein
VVSNFFSSSLVRLWSLSNAAAAAADHQKLPPRRSFLPAHTCCCCGGEGVSISALLEAVATASGNNPGAVEKKKQQKQHQPLLVQELLRKWATKGNVLERECQARKAFLNVAPSDFQGTMAAHRTLRKGGALCRDVNESSNPIADQFDSRVISNFEFESDH